jgi:hypothetical protein
LFGDELEEEWEGGFGHGAVVESGEFAQFGVRVAGDFHHAPEVRIFLITPVEFQLAIAGNDEQGRSFFPHVVERGEFVEERLCRADAAFRTNGEMGNGLRAEGDETCDLIGVHAFGGQPLFIEPDHGRQVAAGGVAADIDAVWRAPIAGDVPKRPCDRGGSVLNEDGRLGLGSEAITRGNDSDAFFFQASRD